MNKNLEKLLGHNAPISVLSVDIPKNVIDEIKKEKNIGIFNVSNDEKYKERILKCDELVFSANSKLTLEAIRPGVPYIAIVAKKIKFSAPEAKTILIRSDFNAQAGKTGINGDPGADGMSEGAGGANGNYGTQGGEGAGGSALKLPDVYLIGGEIVNQPGTPIPWINLVITIKGIKGGKGGQGGHGGKGGNGREGQDAADSCCGCKRGARPGGDGGIGGRGGRGGTGGRGGDGANLIFCGDEKFLDLISFANVVNFGGEGGDRGDGGNGAGGGTGGRGGRASFYCAGESWGRDYSRNIAARGDFGDPGKEGQKGFVDVSHQPDLSIFF